MLLFLARRILSTVPVLVIVALIVFLMLRLAPGDPAAAIVGDSGTSENIAKVREQLGLNESLPVQFFHWSAQLLQGNLGESYFMKKTVVELIGQRIEATVSLAAVTLVATILIAVPLGVLAAWRHGGWLDRMLMGFSVMGFSIPAFVIGYVLIWIFALHLQWLPATGFVSLSEGVWGNLQSMAMPVLSLALIEVPIYLRLLRSEMVSTLQQNFIALARGMGLPTWRILFENALRPSSLNLITVVGINMGRLMGGAVIIESMFALPGLGQLLVESIYQQDYLVTQGIVLFVAVAFIGINLLTDVVYAIVDPRLLRDAEA